MKITLQTEPAPEPDSDRRWSSSELTKALIKSDSAAITFLYENYGGKFTGWLIKKGATITDAEDIVTETVTTLINALKKGVYEENGVLRAYFYRIGLNYFYQRCREQKRDSNMKEGYRLQFEAEVIKVNHEAQEVEYCQKMDTVYAILNQLSDDQKEVFLFRVKEELSFKEIAKRMNKTVSAVKMLNQRAKRKIKKLRTVNK